MTSILSVQSSPNLTSATSRALSKAYIDSYLATHPGTEVSELDLAANPPDHLGPDHLIAYFAPPAAHGPGNTAVLAVSDGYIAQMLAADVLVLGTPIHNFGVASVMKSWIDNVVRAGRTFNYTENGPVGLVPSKKVIIAVGSGGIYSQGPMSSFEHVASYLTDILGVIGLRDVTVLRAEAQNMGPDMAAQGLEAGLSAAATAGRA